MGSSATPGLVISGEDGVVGAGSGVGAGVGAGLGVGVGAVPPPLGAVAPALPVPVPLVPAALPVEVPGRAVCFVRTVKLYSAVMLP